MNFQASAVIEPVRYGFDAICTIISDDGYPSTVEEWYKIALKYNIKVTVAQAIMNISDIQRLQNIEKSNHLEFISHSYSHLKMEEGKYLPTQVLKHEILESKAYMERYFTTSQLAFIPPNNQLSEDAYKLCQDVFYAIRRWTRQFNPLSPEPGKEPLNWLNLGCKGIGDVNTIQERNEWVDQCIRQKKWLIEMWHNLSEDLAFLPVAQRYQAITPSAAEAHVQYICSQRDRKKLWVASFVDAIKYIIEVQTVEVRMSNLSKNVWEIYLSKGISQTDSRFDMPLSVRISFPKVFRSITVEREKGIKTSLKTKEIEKASMIGMEMVPGERVVILADL